jgi:hypothetical protein
MHAALAAAGFDAIAVTEIEVNQSFRDFTSWVHSRAALSVGCIRQAVIIGHAAHPRRIAPVPRLVMTVTGGRS